MSTTANAPIAPSPDDCPTAVIPAAASVPVRRSILRPYGASQASAAPFEGWRGQALTEELEAVPARAIHHSPGRALRHLRHALVGTLLAATLLTGLQLYAAAGISDARQAALEQAALAPALPSPPRRPAG